VCQFFWVTLAYILEGWTADLLECSGSKFAWVLIRSPRLSSAAEPSRPLRKKQVQRRRRRRSLPSPSLCVLCEARVCRFLLQQCTLVRWDIFNPDPCFSSWPCPAPVYGNAGEQCHTHWRQSTDLWSCLFAGPCHVTIMPLFPAHAVHIIADLFKLGKYA